MEPVIDNPASWTTPFVMSLKQKEVLPLLKELDITVRKPFANNKNKARLIDQKNALLYYAGLLNEFSQNDKVIVDTTWLTEVDKRDLDNFGRPPFTG